MPSRIAWLAQARGKGWDVADADLERLGREIAKERSDWLTQRTGAALPPSIDAVSITVMTKEGFGNLPAAQRLKLANTADIGEDDAGNVVIKKRH